MPPLLLNKTLETRDGRGNSHYQYVFSGVIFYQLLYTCDHILRFLVRTYSQNLSPRGSHPAMQSHPSSRNRSRIRSPLPLTPLNPRQPSFVRQRTAARISKIRKLKLPVAHLISYFVQVRLEPLAHAQITCTSGWP